MNQPLFKYTGSKRPIAKKITSYFPENFDTYYEPFLGGGSVFFEVLKQNKVKKFILNDINTELIELFKTVYKSPVDLIASYTKHWDNFQLAGEDYFYSIRDDFNLSKDPFLFHFLMRTCYNGTIRYNSKGEFNTSCHFSRPGMHPDKLEKIMWDYNYLMRGKDITFNNESFDTILPMIEENSVCYLDPPYVGDNSLYQDKFNKEKFEDYLIKLKSLPNCNYFFNLNSINGSDNEQSLNSKLFSQKIVLNSGKSSFSRLHKKDVEVKDFFYIK